MSPFSQSKEKFLFYKKGLRQAPSSPFSQSKERFFILKKRTQASFFSNGQKKGEVD
jgi:hypothetical protein